MTAPDRPYIDLDDQALQDEILWAEVMLSSKHKLAMAGRDYWRDRHKGLCDEQNERALLSHPECQTETRSTGD